MDKDALRQGLVEMLPRLRRYAYALTGAHADADDLLQTTIERILRKGAPDDANLDKWVFRICKNIWIDEIRARRVRVSAVEDGKIEFEENIDGERIVIGKISLLEANKAMDALPDEQRAALSLVALEGYSYADAAQVLDAPIGTIMSRIARARKAIIKSLGECYPGGDVTVRANL